MVMIRQAERPYTADDLPMTPDDGRRYEILGGELIVSPSPSEQHQSVLTELLAELRAFLRDHEVGKVYPAPFDVAFDEYNILQPDLLVVLKEHRDRIESNRVAGAPDLVVEIISHGSRGTDRVKKAATYATFGVREYWLVDPESQTILVQELQGGRFRQVPSGDGMVRSNVLPGLVINPDDIFEEPEWMKDDLR